MGVALRKFILSFDTSSTRAPCWKIYGFIIYTHLCSDNPSTFFTLLCRELYEKLNEKILIYQKKRRERKRKTFDKGGWSKRRNSWKINDENFWINLFFNNIFQKGKSWRCFRWIMSFENIKHLYQLRIDIFIDKNQKVPK